MMQKHLAYNIFQEKHRCYIFEGSIQNLNVVSNNITNKFWKERLQIWLFHRQSILNDANSSIPNSYGVQVILETIIFWIKKLLHVSTISIS